MTVSPLRYPGGKAKLFPFFAKLINANRLFGCEYVEPYAGGAGLAIKLLTDGFVDRISINDIDRGIYAFWWSIFNQPDDLCNLIDRATLTIEGWRKQKEVWKDPSNHDLISLGFSTFYLNRTNRSGIIDGAGPIGGYSQSGAWKIDARFNKAAQIDKVLTLSKWKQKVSLSNIDALDFVKPKLQRDSNCLIYLDPPYYVKGQKLYTNFYEHDDHMRIAKLLVEKKHAKWVVSYDQAPEIRKAYKSVRCVQYKLNYSAAEKTEGSEYIFLSDSLTHPDVTGFLLAG